MEQKKVKAVWFNDPSRTREFTKVAFDMIAYEQGWILADVQDIAEEKKTVPVAGRAVADHNQNELNAAREEYRKVTGKEPDQSWNEPKLFIETRKAQNNKPAIDLVETQPEPVVTETVTEEPVPTAKRKYTKKLNAEKA